LRIAVLGCGPRGLSAIKAISAKYPHAELAVIDTDSSRLAKCVSFQMGDVRVSTSVNDLSLFRPWIVIDTLDIASLDLSKLSNCFPLITSRRDIEASLKNANVLGLIGGFVERARRLWYLQRVEATVSMLDEIVVDEIMASMNERIAGIEDGYAFLVKSFAGVKVIIKIIDGEVEVLKALTSLTSKGVLTKTEARSKALLYISRIVDACRRAAINISMYTNYECNRVGVSIECSYGDLYSAIYATSLEIVGEGNDFSAAIAKDENFVKLVGNLITFGCRLSIEVMNTPQSEHDEENSFS